MIATTFNANSIRSFGGDLYVGRIRLDQKQAEALLGIFRDEGALDLCKAMRDAILAQDAWLRASRGRAA